jgi:predicted RNase H-like nuclease (RuvC/YqgF family)
MQTTACRDRTRPEAPGRGSYLHSMDSETRDAITTMGDTILARMDHYFELQQKQFLGWRAELRGDINALTVRVDALTERVGRLEHEVILLRDYVTREISEIRLELRELRARSGQTDEIRREIAELTVRLDLLERRQQG